MAQVILVCENLHCGEKWMGSDKERSGFCRFCRTATGKKAVEDSWNEVHKINA